MNEEKKQIENRPIVALLARLFQTLSLVAAIGAIRFLSRIEALENLYWVVALVIGALTILIGLVPLIAVLVRERRDRQEISEMEHAQELLAQCLPDDGRDIRPPLFNEGPEGSTLWPRLLLIETAATGFFAAIPALAAFLLTGTEIENPLLITAYLSAPAFFTWVVVECIRFYIFLNQQPRRRSFSSGLAAAVIRILAALVIWIYLGLAAGIESILWLFWVGAGLAVLGLLLSTGHYFAARNEQFEEKITPDLLTNLAGVNKEVQCVLWQAEIYTYKDLAQTGKGDLNAILAAAARPYLLDPATWPYQARLARDGTGNELEAFKRNLHQWQPVDDLTLIFGVDSRSQETFWDNGLFTFRQVADMSADELEDMAARAGIIERVEHIDTWPLQAQLLSDGRQSAVDSLRRQLRQDREVRDLTIIEGIDDEIERRLQTAGIFNYHQISEMTAANLQELLAVNGSSQVDPMSWPHQARLAAEDDWEALEELKLNLKGGKPMDDLTQINGINPAIQSALQQAGILTYMTLAETDVDRLVSILAETNTPYRLSNLITWPHQAHLVLSGKQAAFGDLEALAGRAAQQDDLTQIVGIDDFIQAALNAADITTFEQLAAVDFVRLHEIVKTAGIHSPLVAPTTWPAQARLIVEGKMDVLQTLQSQLRQEKSRDDLTKVAGIDNSVEAALQQTGIFRFSQLANSDPGQIQQITAEAGQTISLNDILNWLYQARLARDGEWQALEKYQAQLAERQSQEREKQSEYEKKQSQRARESQRDDLTRIAGIDRDVMERLRSAGIFTFEQLAAGDVSHIQSLLAGNGRHYSLAELIPWAAQARLAAAGKWEVLARLQAELDIEAHTDPLTILTGIDEKTEALLREGGIFTLHHLAQADVGRLRDILDAAEQPYDLSLLLSWPYQAQLAASGRKETLVEVQSRLKEQTAEPEEETADDLSRIYGINAAIQTILQQNKLGTYARLADSNTGQLQQLLSNSNEPFRLADLITWPYQARLIMDGEMTALKQLQVELRTGQRVDNLQQIEGVGPQIEALFNDNGIYTFQQIAEKPVDTLAAILAEGGDDFRLANPTTWPYQARLAAAGDWAALGKLQAELKGGRQPVDDLTKIEGIGPKIQGLLQTYGVFTYEQLASRTAEQLTGFLQTAGGAFQLADPMTWPHQARLAAAGDWAALNELVAKLKGGRVVDDLALIEGIGPRIRGLLQQSGIFTFKQLGATPIADLRDILNQAGDPYRMADPTTWPYQAQLAAAEKWADLETLQEELQGGRPIDDLTEITGVNTVTEDLFHQKGLFMYAQLSRVSTSDIKTLLEEGGHTDKIIVSRTWPLQAKLLFEEKLEALTRLQDALENGRSIDDLTRIEGIGPKTQELLLLNDIFTYSDLAQQTAGALREILEEGGEPYRLADPTTWPYQAQLAADGKDETLEQLQAHLSGGQPVENLTAVEGIGPKIQQLLWEAHIFTFEQLAQSSAHSLKGVLDAAGEPYHMVTPDTWPEQAQLAADGKWADLEELQELLKGGRIDGVNSEEETTSE